MRNYFIYGIGIILLLIVIFKRSSQPVDFTVSSEQTISQEVTSQSSAIIIQVQGAVEKPGVYTMSDGDRIQDALQLTTPNSDADLDCLNQASKLVDEQNLVVPSKAQGCSENTSVASDGTVNINTATSLELQTLSGIGEAKADAIIDYRTLNGTFTDVEQLLNVDGISEGLLSKLEPQLRLS